MTKEYFEKYEKFLLQKQENYQRMSILDQKSQTRLRYVRHAKQIHLQSTEKCNSLLRMFFISLFEFLRRTNCPSVTFTLKKLVYSSHLSFICRSNGIQQKELHTIFAKQLFKIVSGIKTQQQIIGIFHTVPFFEDILFYSFKEQCLFQNIDDYNVLSKQIEKYFGIKIKIVEQSDKNEFYQYQDFKFYLSKDHRISRISKLLPNDSSLLNHLDSPSQKCLKTISNEKFSEQIVQKQNINANEQISQFNKERNSNCSIKCHAPKKSKGFFRLWCCSD